MATSYKEMIQSAKGLSKVSEVDLSFSKIDPSLGDDHTWFFCKSGGVWGYFFNSKVVDELLNDINRNGLDGVVKSRRMAFLKDLQSVFKDFHIDEFRSNWELEIVIGILRKDINILASENVRKLLLLIENDDRETLALKLIKHLAINEPGKAKKLATFIQQWKIGDLQRYKLISYPNEFDKEYYLAKNQEIEIVEQKLRETYEIQVKEFNEKREKLANLKFIEMIEIIDNRLAKMKISIEAINNVHAFPKLLLNQDYLGIKTMALMSILEDRFDSFLNSMLEVASQTLRHHMLFNALCLEDYDKRGDFLKALCLEEYIEDVIFNKRGDFRKIFRSISEYEHEHEGAFVSALHIAIVQKRLDVVRSLCMSFPSLLLQKDYRGYTPLDYTFFGSSDNVTSMNNIRNLLVEEMEYFLSQEEKRIKHLEESQSETPNSVLTETKFTQHPIFDENCLSIIFSMHDPFYSLGGKLEESQKFIKSKELKQHLNINISELISGEIFKIRLSDIYKKKNPLYQDTERLISEASLSAVSEANKRKNFIMQLVRSINDKLISNYDHAICCSEEAYSELLTEKVCCELLEQEDFSLKHCVIAFEEIEKLREENKKLFIPKQVEKVEETIVEESTFEIDFDDEGWGEETVDAEEFEFEDAENGNEMTKFKPF